MLTIPGGGGLVSQPSGGRLITLDPSHHGAGHRFFHWNGHLSWICICHPFLKYYCQPHHVGSWSPSTTVMAFYVILLILEQYKSAMICAHVKSLVLPHAFHPRVAWQHCGMPAWRHNHGTCWLGVRGGGASFLLALGLKLRASCLLDRCFISWAPLPQPCFFLCVCVCCLFSR
jgi:hypothetical protein